MKFAIRLLLVLIATVWLVPEPVSGIGVSPAFAQRKTPERRNVPNLLDLLFGGGILKQMRPKRAQPAPPPDTRRVIIDSRPAGAAIGGGQPAPKEITEKSPDAAKVLVVGDFLAGGLEWGLEQAFSENPNIVFIDESSGLSGIVRDDVVDWPARVEELLPQVQPIAVIVAVGMNDRQQMRLASGKVEKLSEEWTKEYTARIEKLIAAVRNRNLPLIWLGLVPVSSGKMNEDYLVFNDMYRERVQVAGGEYVDVWDGFTNADGAFISAGPDINGQIVRLRNSDGINLTSAGKRKLAFYAARVLRKATGLDTGAALAGLPGTLNPALIRAPEYDPAETGRTVVISLDDPVADGADKLDGEEGFTKAGSESNTTIYGLVARGEFEPREGRIDAGWGLPDEKKEPVAAQGSEESPSDPAAAAAAAPEVTRAPLEDIQRQ